jgi:hypothetical protein
VEVREPIDPECRRLLRRAVLQHVGSRTGRVHPPVVHVGTPGSTVRRFVVRRDQPTDHALRSDVVAAMLGRRRDPSWQVPWRPPWVWLTRSGELDLHDLDVEWLTAAASAYGEAGVDLTMVVVNRRGWRDPRSGVRQTWVRLRGS